MCKKWGMKRGISHFLKKIGTKKDSAKSLNPFYFLAQRRGFALLAARPARQLSIVAFAANIDEIEL